MAKKAANPASADNGDTQATNDVPTDKPTARLPQLPTRGRVIDFVTDEKVLVPAIVSRIFEEGDVVRMHVSAQDPVFGNRNYHVADVYAAHRPALGTPGLKTLEQLDQEAESLEPGTWSWPQRQ